MTIILATNNAHKVQEFERLFDNWRVLRPLDLGIEFHADETAQTFLGNAMIKAEAVREALYRRAVDDDSTGVASVAIAADEPVVVMADDSGLCVNALSGRPGVQSARYGSESGKPLTDKARYEMLLEELEGEPNRNAYFVCCLVAISDVDRVITVAERWDGEIATEPSNASGGFGYDPVFFLPERNCTAADLSPNEKNRLSHRGRAAAVIKPALAAAING